MRYCLVENNTIVLGPITLPNSSNNISNFDLLTDGELLTYGWYPYVFIDNKQENQVFVESTIEITQTQVIETRVYRNMTQLEIDEQNKKILDGKWTKIRNRRNRLLSSSDWTQLPDSPVDKNVWSLYREQLRNIPQNFSNPDDVVYPTTPL